MVETQYVSQQKEAEINALQRFSFFYMGPILFSFIVKP